MRLAQFTLALKFRNVLCYIVLSTINRGYYIRVKAIHHVLTEFLHYFADHDVQVNWCLCVGFVLSVCSVWHWQQVYIYHIIAFWSFKFLIHHPLWHILGTSSCLRSTSQFLSTTDHISWCWVWHFLLQTVYPWEAWPLQILWGMYIAGSTYSSIGYLYYLELLVSEWNCLDVMCGFFTTLRCEAKQCTVLRL